MSAWGSPVEIERRRRIQLSIAAFAYEFMNESLISDAEFDAAALLVQPEMDTGNPLLDNFFRTEFSPSTGMWIRRHPELGKVEDKYNFLKSILEQQP